MEAQDATTNPASQSYPFEFSGRGGEFFRIWIVNVLLSVLTLGIYSAWAKVRTARYLYGNTRVAGDSFEYHAEPLTILKGRVIAIALLVVYLLLSSYLPLVSLLLLLVVSIAAPWFIVRALQFRARMSSWRNVRFNFVGDTGDAFSAYAMLPMLGFITLGLAMPYVWYRQSQFTADGHKLGKSPFRFTAAVSDFYKLAGVVLVIGVVLYWLVFSVMFSLPLMEQLSEDPESLVLGGVFLVVFSLVYMGLYSIYRGLRFRVLYNNLQLEDNRVTNDVSILRFLFVSVTNSLAILFTLGMFYPWAKMRMNSLLINAMTLHATDVESFVNEQAEETSALGDEVGEAFDLGLGL